jgi:hypothetical protein
VVLGRLLDEMLVVEAGPFSMQASLEQLMPAHGVLLGDELMIKCGVMGRVLVCVVRPHINSIEQEIHEVGMGDWLLAYFP